MGHASNLEATDHAPTDCHSAFRTVRGKGQERNHLRFDSLRPFRVRHVRPMTQNESKSRASRASTDQFSAH